MHAHSASITGGWDTRLRPRTLGLALAGAAFLALAGAAWGQAPADPTQPTPAPAAPRSPLDGKVISELTVDGLRSLEEAYIRNQVRTRPGDVYSADQVQRDVGRLLRTGRFADVRAEPQLVEDRIKLRIVVVEKPEVAALEFVGNRKFKAKDLIKEMPFNVGDPLDPYEVHQGRDTIERLYKEKGYAYAEVTYDEAALKDNRVVYTIVENQRVRVRHVMVEGNTAFDDRELEGEIETKSYIWIFRTGDFNPDRAQRDAATMQQYYRQRGYLDAEVSYEAQFQDVARERLHVIFRVNEGALYKVREIRFQGEQVISEAELDKEMLLEPDEPLVDARLKADLKRIETLYDSRGYIEAQVDSSWVFAEQPEQVILTVTVREGDQFTVGWIEVNGNAQTQEKAVRRELRFYPDEIWDISAVRDSERRLTGTGLFTEATIEPVTPPGPGRDRIRDALVNVTENPKTNNFIAGIGANSDSGIAGNIVVENTNFDITDRPRSWSEFFKGRAFRGAGQTARIQLEPGTELTRFRIDFREPYLADMPIGFGSSVYFFERERDGYDERRIGGNFSFDKRFESGLLKDWAGEVAFRAEYVGVLDRQSFAAKDIRDVEGGNYLSTIKFTLVHDTTDSRFDPSRGHRFSASWEQAGAMGGNFYYSELGARYIKHWTVSVDDQDRKSVISVRAQVGQMLGDAPVFERFYAGGIGSMRGFGYRGISPRQGLRNNRVGGDFMALTGTEYSFPLYAKVVRGVFFTDMGTVEEEFGIGTWRASVGGGVRLTLPIFGTVPMEFDLAAPLSKDGDDDTQWFSFFIGLPFL